jgi:hypothetical protein
MAQMPQREPVMVDPDRRKLASLVMKLFAKWNLDNATCLRLLGMSPNSRSLLAGYRAGTKALPANPDTLDRVSYLLGIHKGLRMLFPHDQTLRFGWVKMPNRRLDGRAPLAIMCNNMVGLARVARYVDWQRER